MIKDELENLVGSEANFYGVDNNCFKLGRQVFEAVEDESDGYRSYLGSIEVRDPKGLTFFGRPVAKVRIEKVDDGSSFDGYQLVDVRDGHVWLRVGTDHADYYYPCFTFQYEVRK